MLIVKRLEVNQSMVTTHCIVYKEDAVVAKKQRVFHVRFENIIRIKPNVYYIAAYSLRGPRTIWGSDPKTVIKFRRRQLPVC